MISGLARGAGRKLVVRRILRSAKVQCLAYRAKGGTTLWLANLTAGEQTVSLSGAAGAVFGATAGRRQLRQATTDPQHSRRSYKAINDPREDQA